MRIKDLKPQLGSHYKQGYYQCINPEKYASFDKRIIYRSNLELNFFKLCDTDKKIIKWASEPFVIKYYHPLKKKKLDYNVDVWFIDDKNQKYLIEIKPFAFLKKPVKPNQNSPTKKFKQYKLEMERYVEIMAKKQAAEIFANHNGMRYLFITENFFLKNGIK